MSYAKITERVDCRHWVTSDETAALVSFQNAYLFYNNCIYIQNPILHWSLTIINQISNYNTFLLRCVWVFAVAKELAKGIWLIRIFDMYLCVECESTVHLYFPSLWKQPDINLKLFHCAQYAFEVGFSADICFLLGISNKSKNLICGNVWCAIVSLCLCS